LSASLYNSDWKPKNSDMADKTVSKSLIFALMTQDFNGKFEIYDQNKLEELFSIWSERQRPATVNNNRIIFGVNLAISG